MRAGPVLLAIAAAAAVPYVMVIGDYFLQDDFGVVSLLSTKEWSHFPQWFVSPWTEDIWGYTPDEVRPFVALSYRIAGIWGAGSPVANHVINIGFHAVNALLVFALARTTAGLSVAGAAASAVIFAWLPMQAESVAWVTGRVDSMPACFYMLSMLLFVRWRQSGSRAAYVWSVAWYFVALFAKQNTVTLPVALAAFDVIIRRQPVWPPHRWVLPYLPFAALTAGYLGLRYALFGEVAREGMLHAEMMSIATDGIRLHLLRLVTGQGDPGIGVAGVALAVLAALAIVSILTWRLVERNLSPAIRAAVFFPGVWLALGIAPTVVAGYASPRHMYLASVGWAIGIGIAADLLWSARIVWVRRGATLGIAALLAFYGVGLFGVVQDWRARAALSRDVVRTVEQEARAARPGTLLLVDAPRSAWDFAVPHALRPPFTAFDVTQRVAVVTNSSLHCCFANLWDAHTRRLLRAWAAQPDQPGVIALYWDETGAAYRLSSEDDDNLRFVARQLPETGSRAALDNVLASVFGELVRFRGRRLAR